MNHQGTKKYVHNRDTSYLANLIQYKSYLKNKFGTRRLVHNKRMFILSDPDCTFLLRSAISRFNQASGWHVCYAVEYIFSDVHCDREQCQKEIRIVQVLLYKCKYHTHDTMGVARTFCREGISTS